MNRESIKKIVLAISLIALVVPSLILVTPQRAEATIPVFDPINWIVNGITAGAAPTTAYSSLGTFTYNTILVPAARLLIRAILMQMTASVVNWINGSNGTGQPSYVLNISAHLQNLGDSVALPFINQIAGMPKSPFSTTIAVALRKNYMQQTSMGGFLDANKCTLSDSSTNVPAFLAGNWSQGGVGAWFALTTQSQNNPYMLYQSAQSQLNSNVNQAQTNRRQDLLQSSGFLSWCGSSDAATQTQAGAQTAMDTCAANGNTPTYCDKVYANAGGAVGGISPGDTCTNKDGTPGKVQTPGSVIHDYTQKAVVASGFDQLISANDLDSAIGQIINALLNKVLGTAGGLLGASKSSGSTPSITDQLNNYQASSTNATGAASQTAQSISTQITAYTSAWSTITNAANAAKVNLTSLQNLCTTNAAAATDPIFIATATAEAAVAQSALTSEVTPVITLAQTASGVATTAQALALKVQTESQSASVSATLASDLSTLIGMPPSITDIANAQTDASVTDGSTASPTGSLTVSGGTKVDQMNLISANAIALKASVCTFSPDSGSPM